MTYGGICDCARNGFGAGTGSGLSPSTLLLDPFPKEASSKNGIPLSSSEFPEATEAIDAGGTGGVSESAASSSMLVSSVASASSATAYAGGLGGFGMADARMEQSWKCPLRAYLWTALGS